MIPSCPHHLCEDHGSPLVLRGPLGHEHLVSRRVPTTHVNSSHQSTLLRNEKTRSLRSAVARPVRPSHRRKLRVRRIIIIAATMLLSTIQVPDPFMKREGDEHRTRNEHCLIRHDRAYLSRNSDALRHKRRFHNRGKGSRTRPSVRRGHWAAAAVTLTSRIVATVNAATINEFMVSPDARASEQRSTGT